MSSRLYFELSRQCGYSGQMKYSSLEIFLVLCYLLIVYIPFALFGLPDPCRGIKGLYHFLKNFACVILQNVLCFLSKTFDYNFFWIAVLGTFEKLPGKHRCWSLAADCNFSFTRNWVLKFSWLQKPTILEYMSNPRKYWRTCGNSNIGSNMNSIWC